MSPRIPQPKRPRRLALPVVLAGSVASLILALGLSPTVAAFTAEIQNTVNTAGSGTLIMEESNSDGSVTCRSTDSTTLDTNSAECTTINKYGGTLTMTPNATVTTTVKIKNVGTAAAQSFTLTPESCSQPDPSGSDHGSATDLCSKMSLEITSGSSTIYSGTLADLGTTPIDLLDKLGTTSVDADTTVPFTFAVTLADGVDNAYAGLEVSQPLTWTFSS